jgi:peptide deformylase
MSKRKVKFIDGEMVEYQILPLVSQYDKVLKERCEEVDFEKMPGAEVAYTSMSLMESVKHYDGLGLSANQVGIKLRMFAIQMLDEGKCYCLINPKVIAQSNEMQKVNEGCLSFPGLFLMIERPSWVEMEFQAANGQVMQKRFEGIYATCALHELDHLDGKVFTDLVPKAKLQIAMGKRKKNLKKIKRVKEQQTRLAQKVQKAQKQQENQEPEKFVLSTD